MGILGLGTYVRSLGNGMVVRGNCSTQSKPDHVWILRFNVWILGVGKHFGKCKKGIARL